MVITIKYLLFFFGISVVFGQRSVNNVCPSLRDYFNMANNTNCWYDYAAELRTPQIIRRSGYPLMEYRIKTEDNYHLTVFRIPSFSKTKPPLFLLHGIESSSAVFVGVGRKSLAFKLADAGYDVWLGNFRGTDYSEGHESLNVTQTEFWDHSVDEIGTYDLPAMLELVKSQSESTSKTIFIGHSLASTAAMIFASERQNLAKNLVSLFIFIGPAYKLTHMRSPYRMFFPLFYPAIDLTKSLNLIQVLSRGNLLRRVTNPTCTSSPIMLTICGTLVNMFVGPSTEMAPETIPVYLNHLPGGTSLKTFAFLRESTSGNFRKYNYGPGKNSHLYGTELPPEYDIKKIQVPIFIIYSAGDWATTKQDAIDLFNQLPKSIRAGIYGIERLNFNHNDYFYGKSADEMVNKPVMEIIRKFLKLPKDQVEKTIINKTGSNNKSSIDNSNNSSRNL